MLALGFSLNLLTILAIVLAVGLVVDAIVVIENVARYMREGMGRVEAALTSSRQLFPQLFAPIVAMTITLATVYAPIGFLSGLTGVLFKKFAFTLAIAVIMSGIVAVTLSPIMSAYVAPEAGRRPLHSPGPGSGRAGAARVRALLLRGPNGRDREAEPLRD
jgi:multidrug efflux pump